MSTSRRPRHEPIDAATPLYLRIATSIREEILALDLSPGDPLQPERILVRDHGVSRMTLRKAIDVLVSEGLVVRKQGLGTFVAAPKVRHPLVGLHSTREIARAYGLALMADVIRFGPAKANRRESNLLGIEGSAPVVRFTRRDLAAGEALCVVDCTLPIQFAKHLTRAALVDQSTYELIEAAGATRLVGARQTLRAAGATKRLAHVLGVKLHSPLLVLERVAYDQDGDPVELAVVSYPYDRAECVVDLRRQPSTRDEEATGVEVKFANALDGNA